MKRIAAVLSVFVITGCIGCSSIQNLDTTPKVELLWPDGAPDAKGSADGDKPTLTIHLPPKDQATGTAVIICPGGGYGHLAIDYEGHEVAQWLNSLGIAGFVLKYRHRGTGYGHPAPLQDAQRAIRTIRSRAKEWNIQPNRIGILGFSAGGHLASTAGTHFDKGNCNAKDLVERASCRPDFMVLVYPVITMTGPHAGKGSRRNLLGENPDNSLIEFLSSEKQVTFQTPPTFLVHGNDDKIVHPQNSILFYQALKKAGVPAEIHIYEHGKHGFGLNRDKGPVLSWPKRCAEWLNGRRL